MVSGELFSWSRRDEYWCRCGWFGGLPEEERNRLFREMNNARKPLEESVGAIDVGGGSAQVVTLSASGFMRKTKKITSMDS